jgi:hypothetical protein
MSNLNNRTVTCNGCGVTDIHKSETTVVTQHETRDMPLFYCKDWKCMAGRISFTEIDVNTYSGGIPTDTNLVVAESSDVEETALVLYGFDEIGMFDDEFNNPVYGFLGDK